MVPTALPQRYELVRELGRGGMSDVWLATDAELGRPVAIKLLRGDAPDTARERIRREARAMARLNHPNVAAIYDVSAAGETGFIAMEPLACSLRDWLAREPRTARAIVDKLVAAGRGLAAAHRAGVIHRDIKPDNVLLDAGGSVKVADFGIAGELAAKLDLDAPIDPRILLVTSDEIAGTPAYMAPEQLRGGAADARSDQFSFCVMAWEALHRALPFATTPANGVPTLARQLAAVTRGWLEPGPRRVSRGLSRVLRRGLAIDPAARYRDLDELADRLTAVMRVRRRVAVMAAVGVLACTALVLVATTRAGGPRPPQRLVVRPLLTATAGSYPPSVAMSRDGRTVAIAIAEREMLTVQGTDGTFRTAVRLPDGLVPDALALDDAGASVAVLGLRDESWELWTARIARGGLERAAVIPQPRRHRMVEVEMGASLAFVGDALIATFSTPEIWRIDAREPHVIARVTNAGRVAPRPGGQTFGVLDDIGGRVELRVLDLAGNSVASFAGYPGWAHTFDWLDANHVVIPTPLDTRTRLVAHELANGSFRAPRELGFIDDGVRGVHASGSRLLAQTFSATGTPYVAATSGGELVPLEAGGIDGGIVGWLDADRPVFAGRAMNRLSLLALARDAAPEVIVAELATAPMFTDGDLMVTESGACSYTANRRGREPHTLAIDCDRDPLIGCSSAGSCVVAELRDGGRVYRTLDRETMVLGDVVYTDRERDTGVAFVPALSHDGRRLAIPRPTGGLTLVDLASGTARELARTDRGAWLSAALSPDGRIFAAVLDGLMHSRIVEVDRDGTVEVRFESRDGFFTRLHLNPRGDMFAVAARSARWRPVIVDLAR